MGFSKLLKAKTTLYVNRGFTEMQIRKPLNMLFSSFRTIIDAWKGRVCEGDWTGVAEFVRNHIARQSTVETDPLNYEKLYEKIRACIEKDSDQVKQHLTNYMYYEDTPLPAEEKMPEYLDIVAELANACMELWLQKLLNDKEAFENRTNPYNADEPESKPWREAYDKEIQTYTKEGFNREHIEAPLEAVLSKIDEMLEHHKRLNIPALWGVLFKGINQYLASNGDIKRSQRPPAYAMIEEYCESARILIQGDKQLLRTYGNYWAPKNPDRYIEIMSDIGPHYVRTLIDARTKQVLDKRDAIFSKKANEAFAAWEKAYPNAIRYYLEKGFTQAQIDAPLTDIFMRIGILIDIYKHNPINKWQALARSIKYRITEDPKETEDPTVEQKCYATLRMYIQKDERLLKEPPLCAITLPPEEKMEEYRKLLSNFVLGHIEKSTDILAAEAIEAYMERSGDPSKKQLSWGEEAIVHSNQIKHIRNTDSYGSLEERIKRIQQTNRAWQEAYPTSSLKAAQDSSNENAKPHPVPSQEAERSSPNENEPPHLLTQKRKHPDEVTQGTEQPQPKKICTKFIQWAEDGQLAAVKRFPKYKQATFKPDTWDVNKKNEADEGSPDTEEALPEVDENYTITCKAEDKSWSKSILKAPREPWKSKTELEVQ